MVTVKDARFEDVLKYGLYNIDEDCVCNLCGEMFELPMDVLEHIIDCHMDDELPDVDPAGEEVGCVN